MAVDTTETKVLHHFIGADASTTFTDESGKVWTARNHAQIDTAQYKFGSSCALFDGTDDYIDTPDHTDFTLGNGDFTFDCWTRRNATGSRNHIGGQCDYATYASGAWSWEIQANNTVLFQFNQSASAVSVLSTRTITDTTTWHHLAIVRNGNSIKQYIDGLLDGVGSVTGLTANDVATAVSIGRPGIYNGFYWNGWIAEFRYIKGLARWTSNFVPMNVPYAPLPAATAAVLQDIVLVGGGGSGNIGKTDTYLGAGGGGGAVNIAPATSFDAPVLVTVGGGSTGIPKATLNTNGLSGGASIVGALSAGGGGGGLYNTGVGGGCGDLTHVGGAPSSIYCGGAGGAGANGGAASANHGGNGGDGLACDYSGASIKYGAGGGGDGATQTRGAGGANGGGQGALTASPAGAGTANYGAGGGGGDYNNQDGGAGSAGVVIIRYLSSLFTDGTGGTITHSGGYTIHTFTYSGYFIPPVPASGYPKIIFS
jgi:hypothetical protein